MGTIAAKTKEHPESVSVEYDIPTTVSELVEKFGEEAVVSAATDSFTIAIQALIRRHIDKSPEDIQALVNDWKPGVRLSGPSKTPFEKASSALGKLSAEERAELLRRLQSGE